jgi:hypothetical protein
LEKRREESPIEPLKEVEYDGNAYTDLDEDGYPSKVRIRWKAINDPPEEKDSSVEKPSGRSMHFRIIDGKPVTDNRASHVITRSKARLGPQQKETRGK